jgi:hypothetical protein
MLSANLVVLDNHSPNMIYILFYGLQAFQLHGDLYTWPGLLPIKFLNSKLGLLTLFIHMSRTAELKIALA